MMHDSLPLVSCIMPTFDRRDFVPRAISYFQRQDYPNKELIIVDDGTDPVADLIPPDERLQYIRLPQRLTIGAKRNLACERSTALLIAHWDDDDWHAQHRLRHQIDHLLNSGAVICGLKNLLFLDTREGKAWRYSYPEGQQTWLSGNSLIYTRAFWAKHRFQEINVGEDGCFVWSAAPEQLTAMADSTFHVGIIHGTNVSPKHTAGPWWQPHPVDDIRRIIGSDWVRYSTKINEACMEPTLLLENPPVHAPEYLPGPKGVVPEAEEVGSEDVGGGLANSIEALVTRDLFESGFDHYQHSSLEHNHSTINEEQGVIKMLTIARNSDLDLPEFRAFNCDSGLPRMRQWELPFTLFQSRLTDTMAILDCTINPVDFSARLKKLFPHVLYRHWNPLVNGAFQLPFGIPDRAFDRVFCVNTLEHLLYSQRELLLSTLARKLKPGGLLVITCDYYFDSFWHDPNLLASGLLRPNKEEVLNGFNKITPEDCIQLCEANGLFPTGSNWETPAEEDTTLLRQLAPYPHACISGVFSKGEAAADQARRKVVLALLTWNTRDVSMDSVHALINESRMLRRLGHEPYLCVCDNGSTDGTQEQLRILKAELDLPHHFIMNASNVGNSVARNQIIDYMLLCDADYLLFMDGDIEVVPFSSYAMVRYMEHHGAQLGCIGACSAEQTNRRDRATSSFFNIEKVETINLVAWTQYGLFRKEVFSEGVRFDERGPFTGPGWGFEDNDLAFQMEMKGFVNQRFFGMTYLHRDARSSIRVMKALGIDPNGLYAEESSTLSINGIM